MQKRRKRTRVSYMEGALVAAMFAAAACGVGTELLYSHLRNAATGSAPSARAHDVALLIAAAAFLVSFFMLQALAHASHRIAVRYARAWLPLVIVGQVAVWLRVRPAITSVCLLACAAWAYPRTTLVDRVVLSRAATLRDGNRASLAEKKKQARG